jgi:AcrR family transcriptional regulator
VYRYFPSVRALLVASVEEGIGDFLDEIAAHLAHQTSPAEAVVEGIAFTYEQIHHRADLALVLAANAGSVHEVTSDTSITLGRSILDRLPVDWAAAGYDDAELSGLVELMLRTLQSFVVDPGDTAGTPETLRAYLRRWVGPAVDAIAVTR